MLSPDLDPEIIVIFNTIQIFEYVKIFFVILIYRILHSFAPS